MDAVANPTARYSLNRFASPGPTGRPSNTLSPESCRPCGRELDTMLTPPEVKWADSGNYRPTLSNEL